VIRIAARRRRSSAFLLVEIAFLLALSSVGPAGAHTFTKADGNDSPGKLDIRSATVTHASTGVIYKIVTYDRWTPRSLESDSFFLVQIDKNNDRSYERCAFITFDGQRLRGSITNCGTRFIRYLPVAKLNGTTVRITIPTSQTGLAYWWAVASIWDGPAPCANGCVDFAPNLFPDILHDLIPPVVDLATDPLLVSDDATSPSFVFPFTVTDAHSKLTWRVERRLLETTAWATVSSGSGGGSKDPSFTGVAPGQYQHRVVAIDAQGNRKNSAIRLVQVPTDVDADTGPGTSVGGIDSPPDSTAYGGSFIAFDDLTDSYTVSFVHPGGPCRDLLVIGPGSGDWTVEVSDGVGTIDTIQAADIPAGARQVLYAESLCADATRIFTVTGGTDGSAGFGVDAVLL
jgi:hypothetical protein